MKKINLENVLFIYNEGELDSIYEVKKTKKDITEALKDYGYFNDFNNDDWKTGVGEDECHSFKDVVNAIFENGSFFEDSGDRFFTIDGSFPR